jgi:hypothetical protein
MSTMLVSVAEMIICLKCASMPEMHIHLCLEYVVVVVVENC